MPGMMGTLYVLGDKMEDGKMSPSEHVGYFKKDFILNFKASDAYIENAFLIRIS